MNPILKTAKEVLQKYEYLHINAICELIKNNGVFEKDLKNPEDILNNLILEDIKEKKINSTFIQVGLAYYAIRKPSEEENLFSYMRCRLRNFVFREIDKHDVNFSINLFGKDLFSENDKLLSKLEILKNTGKISSFTHITNGQFIVGF